MALKEGKYYLICNYDKYDNISNYRLDRIRDIKILKEQIKPFSSLEWANGQPLDPTYMREHIYSSESTHAKLRITRSITSAIIDIFGKEVKLTDENGVTVQSQANETAVEQFAKSFAPYVIVTEPASLVEKIRKTTAITLEKYNEIR